MVKQPEDVSEQQKVIIAPAYVKKVAGRVSKIRKPCHVKLYSDIKNKNKKNLF